MKVVLDNNILFSLINPDSVNSYLFAALRFEFFAPEYIKSELAKYASDCLLKSKLSKHEFEMRQKEVEAGIRFCKISEFKRFLKQAKDSLPDKDDAPYVALALAIKSVIWSNDPHLKQQSLAKVFTTAELINKLLKSEF
ncbi:MAG: PIN domain-containing protein [Nanoarchaeota archaeon]|nr:PIN domain-containing protein [Nanoarchaeota archaeon]